MATFFFSKILQSTQSFKSKCHYLKQADYKGHSMNMCNKKRTHENSNEDEENTLYPMKEC